MNPKIRQDSNLLLTQTNEFNELLTGDLFWPGHLNQWVVDLRTHAVRFVQFSINESLFCKLKQTGHHFHEWVIISVQNNK